MKYIIALISIAIISIIIIVFIPLNLAYKSVIAVPGSLSLIAVLFQILRDESSFQKNKHLQESQNYFNIVFSSEMASEVLKKQIIFLEEYYQRLQSAINEFTEKAEGEHAGQIGDDLQKIRIKYSIWLSSETRACLQNLEKILFSIYAKSHRLKNLQVGPERSKIVDQLFLDFNELFGSSVEPQKDTIIDKTIEHLRKIMGVDILTSSRFQIIEKSSSRNIFLKYFKHPK